MKKFTSIESIVDDLHAKLLVEWPDEKLTQFFVSPWVDGDINVDHFGLGMAVRNNYNLWAVPWEPEMKMYHGIMCDCSPYHPDAVSSTIIKQVWAKGHNK